MLEAGGTISASQGCGLARTQFLPRQYGDLVQVFREIKDAFDPLDLLNPGKVIGDDPHLMVRDLKRFPPRLSAAEQDSGSWAQVRSPGSRRLRDRRPRTVMAAMASSATVRETQRNPRAGSPTRRAESALSCPSCDGPNRVPGDCLGLPRLRRCAAACEPTLRMCPSFRAHGTEAASPRSQANLLRQVATGPGRPQALGQPRSSRPTPTSASTASSASRNAPRGWTSPA